MFRRSMKKSRSRRVFSRTAKKVNRRNMPTTMRGGRRI